MAESKESKAMEEYFSVLDAHTKRAYEHAEKARKKGYDPETNVDIPLTKNMAERVEGLMKLVAPQLVGKGMVERILELEKEFAPLDWRVALKIAAEVSQEKFCSFSDKREAMEVGIRCGFAYATVGVVSAPLEGFVELRIKKRQDGQEYTSLFFSGPIRGAGGTAASVCVIIADYVRVVSGYAPFDPTPLEVKRAVSEIYDYHERVTNLQYIPSKEEIEFLASHLPVEINGDPTEDFDVSNFKDLPRLETNRIRGGMCLVMAEGLAQKSKKIWKRLGKWGKDFQLEWGFLEEYLTLQRKIQAHTKKKDEKKEKGLTPNYTFIADLVAGRPVLTHPMANGGFRLRYGRTRTSGFSSAAISPFTMLLLNRYVAVGTQLKIERPGKASSMTTCDTIEGPIVKLTTGEVMRITTIAQAKEASQHCEEILYLGDILVNYGDFSENNHPLVPVGYCEEWWLLELKQKEQDAGKIADKTGLSQEKLTKLLENALLPLSPEEALLLSESYSLPLHPYYIFYYSTLTVPQLLEFISLLQEKANIIKEHDNIKITILVTPEQKRIFELLGIPHNFSGEEYLVISQEYAPILLRLFSKDYFSLSQAEKDVGDASLKPLDIINNQSTIIIRDKAGTFIGARMGRPEKAKQRHLTGSPHVLFPVGDEGGRLRSFQAAMEKGTVSAEFPFYICDSCGSKTVYSVCDSCGARTRQQFFDRSRGVVDIQRSDTQTYKKRQIDIKKIYEHALEMIGDKVYPDLVKGVRGTSNKDHIPEHLMKGILRAQFGIYVNKDGTTRYDMTELPITHFKPAEIRTSLEKLKELGYTKDILGQPLLHDQQILELKPQDIILSSCPDSPDDKADDVLFNVCMFIDKLLVKLYGQEPFYALQSKGDLMGQLVVGLAPHTSAGIVGRIIGFSKTQGLYCHPMFHAAMRRDCDGDESCVMMLMDALLNFSRQYLPNKRGSRTMDAPLVLTAKLIPTEVDDQVHGIDVAWSYPLALYEAALQMKYTWEVPVEQLNRHLGTPRQYEGFGFTHSVSNINQGVLCSAYKTLPSMQEKLEGQMDLARKIRAVDTSDVARLVIEKHFLKDLKGNLRKFSMQKFCCTKCDASYRRPPLVGKCTTCGGKLKFTISEGSVIKYLESSLELARKYNVPAYLKQTVDLTKKRVDHVFGKEEERQEGLKSFFS